MIKLKKLLEEIKINERISDKVWHFTSLVSLIGILNKNAFELSKNEYPAKDKPNYKKYYMSLSRIRSGGFPERSARCISARVELDGEKLSQRYKGAATAYFTNVRDRDEFEDRLFSDDQYIKNAKDYIKTIDIWPNKCIAKTRWPLDEIMDTCLQMGIQLRYFENKQKYYAESGGIVVTKENQDEILNKFMEELGDIPKTEGKINERISSIVYHFTTMHGFESIMISDKFKLADNPLPDPELEPYAVNPEKYSHFMSVARTRTPGYSRISRDDYKRPLNVRFQLDGNKLSANYKGKPFDYFSALQGNAIKKNQYDEFEDRVYHSDRYIPKATSYITRIDVNLDGEDVKVRGVRKMLYDTLVDALSSNIPLYLYKSEKDFNAQLRGIQVKDKEQLDKLISNWKIGEPFTGTTD